VEGEGKYLGGKSNLPDDVRENGQKRDEAVE